MIYGPPGGGKTRLAGTSPGGTVIMNCDGETGPESIRSFQRDADLEIINIDGISMITEVLEWVKAGNAKVGTDDVPVEWLWLDTVTLLQEREMDRVLEDVVQKKPHRDPDVPDMPEYLKVQNRLKRIVRELIGLPVNIGITAHEMLVETDDDLQTWPAITGKLMPQKVSGLMGLVARLTPGEDDDGKPETRVRLRGTSTIYARNRYGGKVPGIKNPDMPRLLTAITK